MNPRNRFVSWFDGLPLRTRRWVAWVVLWTLSTAVMGTLGVLAIGALELLLGVTIPLWADVLVYAWAGALYAYTIYGSRHVVADRFVVRDDDGDG